MKKKYGFADYKSLFEALEDCDYHIGWNVINIYPIDGGKTRVIYYIEE